MMKHSRITRILMILLVTPLLISGWTTPFVMDDAKIDLAREPVRVSVPSYDAIFPIVADGDAELVTLAGVMSWDGDGSPGDPFIIEGYSITNNSNCIDILDVSLAFEIHDCYIVSQTGTNGYGIIIENATQVSIFDTIVESKASAVEISHVPAPYLDNVTIHDSGDNLYLMNCTGATVNECEIYDNFNDGIFIAESNDTTITNNYINGTIAGEGIEIFISPFATIDGNHIFNCGSSGLKVGNSDNVTIENNIIHDNWFSLAPECGIHLVSSDYVSF